MDENMLGSAVEKLKDMLSSEDGKAQIQDIIGAFTGGADSADGFQESGREQASEGGFDPSDMETILKIQQVVRSMNSGEASRDTQFLRSLRPYLKDSRRKKLDSAVKLLGAANAMKTLGILNNEDGEN